MTDQSEKGTVVWKPTDADVRAFANAYGYSVAAARDFLLRNGPDARTSLSGSSHGEGDGR